MPSLGPPELILIVVILLILFGPGKLSGLGSSLGKSIREFRKSTSEPEEESVAVEPTPIQSQVVGKVVEEERREIRRPTVTIGEQTDSHPSSATADRENRVG